MRETEAKETSCTTCGGYSVLIEQGLKRCPACNLEVDVCLHCGRLGPKSVPCACVYSASASELRELIDECCVWARSRIAACRAEEQKFGAGDVAVEASTERRALQAVLRILTGEET